MKRLIVLNVLVTLLLTATLVAGARYDGPSTATMGLVVLFLGLAVVSLFAPIFLWKRNRLGSLFAPLSLIVAAFICFTAAPHLIHVVVAGTPQSPETFLQGSTKHELEAIAKQLLDDRVRVIEARRSQATDVPLASMRAARDTIVATPERLCRLGIMRTRVDASRRVVTFAAYHDRTWNEYLMAADGVPARFSDTPVLTEADVVDWGEVRRIAATLRPGARTSRSSVAFEPSVVVPYFRHALGDSFFMSFHADGPVHRITSQEKARVLAALDLQRSANSGLLESQPITLEGDPLTLHVGADAISDGFWVSGLAKQLLAQGVVRRAPDGRHLRIVEPLSPADEIRVEWFHVGLMNNAYGNLIEKSPVLYRGNERRLDENWYYRAW